MFQPLDGGARGVAAETRGAGQDEFFLFASGQDFVKVDGDAEGDEEEAADAGAEPVGWLEGGRGGELSVEGGGAGG